MSSSALPPAGWYDDPDRVGHHRFWNGAAWTEDRRPAPIESPPPPPHAVAHREFAPQAPVVAGAEQTRLICPVCGQADMLRNVGVLFDEGTSVTDGISRTVTTGYGSVSGMGSDGTLYSGSTRTSSVGTTSHHSVTRTQLAGRFVVPSRPRGHFGSWLMLGWFGSALLIALLWGPTIVPANAQLGPVVMTLITIAVTFVFALVITWIVGLVVAFIQRSATAASLARRQVAWDTAYLRFRNAAFCARDGVAVEGGRAYSPEGLREVLFGG